MARKLAFLLPVGLFAVLLVAFAMGLNRDPQLLPSALINRPAPDFSLPGLFTTRHRGYPERISTAGSRSSTFSLRGVPRAGKSSQRWRGWRTVTALR